MPDWEAQQGHVLGTDLHWAYLDGDRDSRSVVEEERRSRIVGVVDLSSHMGPVVEEGVRSSDYSPLGEDNPLEVGSLRHTVVAVDIGVVESDFVEGIRRTAVRLGAVEHRESLVRDSRTSSRLGRYVGGIRGRDEEIASQKCKGTVSCR